MAEPTDGPDELHQHELHQRHKLGILTIAAKANRAEFGYLLETLGLTPTGLSRHLTALEDEGLVEVEIGHYDGRRRIWVRVTRNGRSTLSAELDLLAALTRLRCAVRAAGVQLTDPPRDPHAGTGK